MINIGAAAAEMVRELERARRRTQVACVVACLAFGAAFGALAAAAYRGHEARCAGGYFELVDGRPHCVGAGPALIDRWTR